MRHCSDFHLVLKRAISHKTIYFIKARKNGSLMQFLVHQSLINSTPSIISCSVDPVRHVHPIQWTLWYMIEETVAYYHGNTFGSFKWKFLWSAPTMVTLLLAKRQWHIQVTKSAISSCVICISIRLPFAFSPTDIIIKSYNGLDSSCLVLWWIYVPFCSGWVMKIYTVLISGSKKKKKHEKKRTPFWRKKTQFRRKKHFLPLLFILESSLIILIR